MKAKIYLSMLLSLFIVPIQQPFFHLNSKENVCAVYITGVGCPHCAQVDPIILGKLPRDGNIIIEYEIYKQKGNAPLIMEYGGNYNSGLGIPQIIFSKDKHFRGDKSILKNIPDALKEINSNKCPLKDGSSVAFTELDLTTLPGKPKIWKGERVLIKKDEGGDNAILKELLTTEDLSTVLGKIKFRFRVITPFSVAISGGNIYFDNAIELDGWVFQWNSKNAGVHLKMNLVNKDEKKQIESPSQKITKKQKGLGLHKIFILALADTVNPCALAVFLLFLVGIMSHDPERGRKILLAGAAFVSAVYVCYFIYGLIIVKLWQVVQALSTIRLVIYRILGCVAILLGFFHLKDFFRYKPGGFATEMPMGWRGKVKKMMLGITSIRGAFIMGAFVTIFLMPCTMGPYLIAGGILSALDLIKAIPWLLVYNLIFILPLYCIVLLVYFGLKRVQDIFGWKERNVRRLHLIVGFIMLFIGLSILLGWI